MTGKQRAMTMYRGAQAAIATMDFVLSLRLAGKTITVDAADQMANRADIPEPTRGLCREFVALAAEMPVPWSQWCDDALGLRYNEVVATSRRFIVDAGDEFTTIEPVHEINDDEAMF